MLFRRFFWLFVATSALAAGCSARREQVTGMSPGAAAAQTAPRPDKDAAGVEDAIEAHAHYGAGIIHGLNNEPELALKEYYLAASKDPTNEVLILEISRQFLQAKQPEQALELLVRATAHPGASGALFARLGFVYAQLGKADQAIKASRIAIHKQPQSLAGYQNLFLNYFQTKQLPEAASVLEEAARAPGTDPEFLIGLAELHANLGLQVPSQRETAFTKALAVLQRVEPSKINEPALRLRLADDFNLLGKDTEAAEIYLDLLKQLPDSSFVRENVRAKLADIYLRNRDRARAVEQLEAIIRDNPTDAQAYYYLGSIAVDAKNQAQAVDYFTKTLLLDPDYEQAYYDLAAAQVGLNKNSEALATLEKARQKFSQTFLMEYMSGVAWSRQKEYTNALRHLTAAEIIGQARDPRRLNELFFFEFGTTFERAGDFVQAEKYFEKCLALSPDFAEAQNYLGYMLADRGEKLDRARELIEKALKAEPKSAAYLDSMGWVLFRLNRPQEGLEYILKALEASDPGGDAEIYNHLGDIYAALGQSDKARDAWQKSISIEPNENVRKKLEPLAR